MQPAHVAPNELVQNDANPSTRQAEEQGSEDGIPNPGVLIAPCEAACGQEHEEAEEGASEQKIASEELPAVTALPQPLPSYLGARGMQRDICRCSRLLLWMVGHASAPSPPGTV